MGCLLISRGRNRWRTAPFYSRKLAISGVHAGIIGKVRLMLRWFVLLGPAALLAGCISSSNPPPPAPAATVVVPQGSTVVCSNGAPGPC
jgi:hypothetical protein